ncbi:MAG TPA: hypothetical protein VHT03_01780 [Rhizomicrobium sp.]|jgi:elongation factor G|nr:hypothetical protein [Rhizomicrobium sp.]
MRLETITCSAEATYTHKKVFDGGGEFAKVTLRLEPLPSGGGFEFVNAALPLAIPIEFIEGVEEGIKRAAETGIVSGGPVIDLRVTLLDGAYHEMDSNPRTFGLAAKEAFWSAMRNAGPRVLST